jgi:hypothetical protein
MVDQRGTLEVLAEEVGSAFAALQDVLRVDSLATLFLELGLDDDPPAVGGDSQFVQTLTGAADQCSALEAALQDLAEKTETGDLAGRLEALAHVIEAIVKLTVDLDAVATDLKRATAEAANAATIAAFAEELAGRVLETAMVRHLETVHPVLERILAVLTLVEITPLPLPPAPPPVVGTGDGASVIADAAETVPLARRRLHLDRLGQLLQDPLGFVKTAYDWGDESFDGKKLFVAVSQLFDALGPLSVINEAGDAAGILSFFVLSLAPTGDVHPPGMDGLLHVDVTPSAELVIARPSESSRFSLRLTGAFSTGLELRLLPPAELAIVPPEGPLDGDVRLGFVGERPEPQEPFVVLGQTGGSRLQARRLDAGFVGDMKWDGAAGRASADVGFEVDVTGGVLVLDPSGFDGFLSRVLPADGLRVPFDFGLTWSAERGFAIRGAGGLDATVPVALSLGPASVVAIHLSLQARGGGVTVEVSAGIGTAIGPVQVAIDRLGVAAALAFPEGDGNLAVADVRVGVKPPSGLGISIDAEVVTGGGFLSFDPELQEYAGALEVQLGKIGLKAVGVLSTGPDDWSLALLLYAQIPPIQLGFGFTLDAIGGLIGVQRGMDVDQLVVGMTNGAFDDILFPSDPVRDAPRILGRLRTLFPARRGALTVGPMVDVHWGEPLMLTARLAILLELDNALGSGGGPLALARIVLVGQLHVEVGPTEQDPHARVVRLIVDVLGFWDLADRRYGFLARLRDSTIGGVDITGGLGVWGEYGDQPRFLLAAGGFNPRFHDVPAQLSGGLDRLGASFSVGRFHLALTGYFALTPATIQAGLDLRATATIGGVGLNGDIGFDVLVYRRPRTHFIADFHIIAEVTYHGHTLAGVKVTGTVEGPGQWHVVGSVTFSILWWDISTSFDESWGSAAALLTDLVDVAALLGAALAVRENWSAQLPAGSETIVTLAPRRGDQEPRAHPLGRFAFSQQVAPLGLTLEKFGDSGVSGPNHFDVESVTLGGRPIAEAAGSSHAPVREHFARAQFLEMSEEDRLTRPAFEEMDAGVQFSSSAFEVGAPLPVGLGYETKYVDLDTGETRPEPRAGVATQALGHDLIAGFARYGAAGRAPQRATEQMGAIRLPLAVSAPPVTAADRRTLAAVDLGAPPTAAQMVVEQRIRGAGAANAQVVEAFELVEA